MKRRYHHCPECGKRMRRFRQDADRERAFYICHTRCGNRVTIQCDINAMADDWPDEVFNEAVRVGLITKQGRPIPG